MPTTAVPDVLTATAARTAEAATRPPRTAARLARGAGTGLLLGAGLGVLARAWMRGVSTDPSFSWEGTVFILGLFAWAGLLVGVVRTLRLSGRSPWWRLLLLPGLALFAGPGAVLLPGTLVAGWGLAGRGPRLLRAAALVLALAVLPVVMWFVVASPLEREVLNPLVLSGGFALVQGLLAAGAAELFRRRVVAG